MPQNSILFIYLIALVAFFYFFIYRPQQRQRKAQQDLLGSLAVDDQVLTVSGMYGTIRALEDDSVQLEIADGVVVRMAKAAIARKLEV
jgi:preprotein translocase subunit YajC